MKARIVKSILTITLVCSLALSLTGCKELDYRKAIKLYNAGSYETAAAVFYELGDYEDAGNLYADCQYWIAANLAQQGNYQEALPRFLQLGEYENSAQWVTECNYQIALTAFAENRLQDAQAVLQEIPDYKQAKEYLRRINWQNFFDTLAETPLYKETDEKVYSLIANVADNRLEFYVGSQTDQEFTFHNDLTLTVSRDSIIAEYIATDTFSMDYLNDSIGSEQYMSGRVDISTYTAQTLPLVDHFEKTVKDNRGNTTSSTDPADNLMTEQILADFQELFTVIPELISEAGFELTLNDIGFSAI